MTRKVFTRLTVIETHGAGDARKDFAISVWVSNDDVVTFSAIPKDQRYPLYGGKTNVGLSNGEHLFVEESEEMVARLLCLDMD